MGDLLDRPDFTDNVGLQAMRNAWRENHEHFDTDRYGIWPVDVAVAEAETHIGIYERLYPDADARHQAPEERGQRYDSPEGFSGTPTQEICEVCKHPSSSSPCDECYQMIREVADPSWGFGMVTRFCVVCFDVADAQGKLCATCRALLDGPRSP